MSSSAEVRERDGGSPSSATSRSLLARVQADEPAAWERLVRLYSPLVAHWCRGLSAADAADVFQEVFRAVVAHVAGFRRERGGDSFRGWLRRITQNKVRDHYRKAHREARATGGSSARDWLANVPADESLTSDDHEAAKECDLLGRALEPIRAEFAERTWSAFWRTAVEGKTAEDVGHELGMSAGAVRVAKSRVLHRLREELGDLL